MADLRLSNICQNCETPSYFRVANQNTRYKALDSYPKLEVTVDEELPDNIKVAFKEAMNSYFVLRSDKARK